MRKGRLIAALVVAGFLSGACSASAQNRHPADVWGGDWRAEPESTISIFVEPGPLLNIGAVVTEGKFDQERVAAGTVGMVAFLARVPYVWVEEHNILRFKVGPEGAEPVENAASGDCVIDVQLIVDAANGDVLNLFDNKSCASLTFDGVYKRMK